MTESVEHADNVERANTVAHADTTAHVDNVERLETHDNQPTNVGTVERMNVQSPSKWRAIADLGGIITVLAALAITWLSQATFSTETQRNRELIQQAARVDRITQEQLVCQAKYQDAVDSANVEVSIRVADLIVVAVQMPAGPEKTATVELLVVDLQNSSAKARAAVGEKAVYIAGPPTPCPI